MNLEYPIDFIYCFNNSINKKTNDMIFSFMHDNNDFRNIFFNFAEAIQSHVESGEVSL